MQPQSTSRLTKVNVSPLDHFINWANPPDLQPGKWSRQLHTGNNPNTKFWHYIDFFISNDEVRPQNMAVKIWKRIP